MKKPRLINVLVIGLVLYSLPLEAQTKAPKSVAIFLYPGVELLDFAGPGEVFSAAGFDVFTMSLDGKELVSQRFVSINPQYSLTTAPTPDIVVFPGGGSGPTSRNPDVMKWVRECFRQGTFLMSVCTGASIIGNTGLVKNMNITTWHGFIPDLQKMLPDSRVLENTRFVDNGRIITTAGVSAGIDGALHLVSRVKGLDAAKRAARYMEYDKWDPANGRTDRSNELITNLRSEGPALEKEHKVPTVDINTIQNIPYQGELKNLAYDFHEAKLYNQEAFVLELTVKLYPNGTAYTALAQVYKLLGKPAPVDEEKLVDMINGGKVDEALSQIDEDIRAFPFWRKMYSEDKINDLGYQMIRQNRVADAIKIFQFNTRLFPGSFNTFDSLAEGYFMNANYDLAMANYEKSLELNPDNENGKQMIEKIRNMAH